MDRVLAPHAEALPVAFGRSFGWLHPASGSRGVILCSTNGYEELCCHRPWSTLAHNLAATGLPTLRFDYPGCGDSPEGDDAPERVSAWLEGIRDAVAFLRAQTGVAEVTLVGLRFGATLAVAAAQELASMGQGVGALVLLAPSASGAAYFKELRLLSMMAKARQPQQASTLPGLEAAGFYYSASTVAEMKALDPAARPVAPAPRILILDRADGNGGAILAGALRTLGAEVEEAGFDGYNLLMRDAAESEYPEADFRRVLDWLSPGTSGESARTASAPAPQIAGPEIAVPGAIEHPVWIEGATPLFGIFSEPEVPAPHRPVLLILNTGANHHIGTNRMSVLISRRLAQNGAAALRIDLGGVGDSPSVPGRPDKLFGRVDLVADVRQAVDWLARRGYRDITVSGLCAGGWLGYHAALAEPRITGQILLNLQNLWPGSPVARAMESNRNYLRLLRNPMTWQRLARGKIRVGAILTVLLHRCHEALATRLKRLFHKVAGAATMADRTRAELRALAARNLRTDIIYVASDVGLDELELHFGRHGRAIAVEPNLHITIIEEGDHLFSMKRSRDRLIELMADRFRRDRTQPAPATEAPAASPAYAATILDAQLSRAASLER
jgi:pimeloyl-ACP methyl ester carboxylesterase